MNIFGLTLFGDGCNIRNGYDETLQNLPIQLANFQNTISRLPFRTRNCFVNSYSSAYSHKCMWLTEMMCCSRSASWNVLIVGNQYFNYIIRSNSWNRLFLNPTKQWNASEPSTVHFADTALPK